MSVCPHDNIIVQRRETSCRETGYRDEWFTVRCLQCGREFSDDEWCEEIWRQEKAA